MNSEFFAALDELEQKRGISKEYMIEKIEAALVAAYKKEYGNNTNVRVSIDENKKDVRVFQQKTVVAEVEDPETEISLEEAKLRNKRSTVGKILEFELKPKIQMASIESAPFSLSCQYCFHASEYSLRVAIR